MPLKNEFPQRLLCLQILLHGKLQYASFKNEPKLVKMSKLNDGFVEILHSAFLPLRKFENVQNKKFF